jgi:hypothetical protein
MVSSESWRPSGGTSRRTVGPDQTGLKSGSFGCPTVDHGDSQFGQDEKSEKTEQGQARAMKQRLDDHVTCGRDGEGHDEDEERGCQNIPGRGFDVHGLTGFDRAILNIQDKEAFALACGPAEVVHGARPASALGQKLDGRFSVPDFRNPSLFDHVGFTGVYKFARFVWIRTQNSNAN